MTYGYLMAYGRLERRAEWALKLLERYGLAGARRRLLLVAVVCTLGWYVTETILLGAGLSGLLLLTMPATALSLLFASLLATAAAAGFSTVWRTVALPDKERLLLAPVPDRRAYALAFWGGGTFELFERSLVLPVASGVAVCVAFGARTVSLPALCGALAIVAAMGAALAVTVDRAAGAAWVRRTRRGARGASAAAYVLSSAAVFFAGALSSRAIVPWLASAPAGGDLLALEPTARWASSLPDHVLDAAAPLGTILTHPASPPGALARGVMTGDMTGFGVAVLWAVAAAAVAVVLWARGGGWYRSEWLGGWREWTRDDLFGLAEKAYVVLARIFFRGDRLLEVQLRNLCRCREGSAAGPFDLVGGSFVWLWAGLAVGAAPVLRGSPDAGALFVLVVGGWATSVSARAPFADLRGSLYVDAEGRQAGLYRAAGVGAIELYRAKLRAGRLVAGVALGAVTALGVVLGGLSLGSCLLLTAIGVASWTIWPHTELLPGLASPHFGWEHPDELGTHHEQRGLRDLTEGIVGVFSIFDLLLIVLLLSGWLPSAGFTGVAVALVLLKTAAASATFRALGHRAARATDRTDLCS